MEINVGMWVRYFSNTTNRAQGWSALGQISAVHTDRDGVITSVDVSSHTGGCLGLPVRDIACAVTEEDLAEIRFATMVRAAVDWTYLQVISGGIGRKSVLDSWLMQKFSIDAYTARQISNAVTAGPIYFTIGNGGAEWQAHTAGRDAPRLADYPDFVIEPL